MHVLMLFHINVFIYICTYIGTFVCTYLNMYIYI